MTFIEERLLDKVVYGSQFGKEFNTRIVSLRSGVDRRNADWAAPLGRYSVLYELLEPEDHKVVVNAHMACMGALIGFRFKDWSDYEVLNELLVVSDGGEQTVQLTKEYKFGPITYTRKIVKPVSGTIKLYADDVEIPFTVDTTSGLVTFNATSGQAITWSGEFDVPVRFDNDRLDVEPVYHTDGGFLLSTDVDLTEVRL
jgi:uncharacterized protein (TIGR02217 family)